MADALHNSYEPYYRSPRGAVVCGQRITLRLRVDAAHPVQRAELLTWFEGVAHRTQMEDIGVKGAWHAFEACLTAPDTPGLIWYHFYIHTQGSSFFAGNAPDGLGGPCYSYSVPAPSYQITVYERELQTPKWMCDSVMYQILPDRFFDGRNGEYLKRRPEVRVHTDWYEPPDPIIAGLPGYDIAKDFFGGNLPGIEQRLDYIQSLGVNVLYLNPIFKAHSNHKYDTGDYTTIDPTFGDEADFRALCDAAEKRGMRVVLDGVFSHTGEDSLYFNRYGHYDSVGAYQSKKSPYAAWYTFTHFPDEYVCWWGVPSLPEINEMHPSFLDFIIHDEDSVISRWIRAGASGWRLDVADELPDAFISMLRERVKRENPEACIIGEVWEDATNKVAYGQARTYALGNGLDSVMNYPLRTALIDFLKGNITAARTRRLMMNQRENYPLPMYYSLMNILGSHDRPRIINVLAGCDNPTLEKDRMGEYTMEPSEYRLGVERLKLMLAMIAFLPGMPCLYYGDEAGLEGLGDPYCRKGFPWGREDAELQAYARDVLTMRRKKDALRTGDVYVFSLHEDVLAIVRTIRNGRDVFGEKKDDGVALLVVNRNAEPQRVTLDLSESRIEALVTHDGSIVDCPGYVLSLTVPARGSYMLYDA